MPSSLRRPDLADSLVVLGGLILVVGIALIHLAAAVVVGGLELIVAGLVIIRRPHGTAG